MTVVGPLGHPLPLLQVCPLPLTEIITFIREMLLHRMFACTQWVVPPFYFIVYVDLCDPPCVLCAKMHIYLFCWRVVRDPSAASLLPNTCCLLVTRCAPWTRRALSYYGMTQPMYVGVLLY